MTSKYLNFRVTPLYFKELVGSHSAKMTGAPRDPALTAMDPQAIDANIPCVVGGAHAFILRISSYFGLAPLRFEPHSRGFIVTLSTPKCVYSYILVTVLVICTVLGLVAEINVGMAVSVRMSSRVSRVVSVCDVLNVLVTAGAGVYGAPRRMKTMLQVMRNVASVDSTIAGQYSIAAERKLCATLLAILISFLVLLVDDFCFYVFEAKKKDRQSEMVMNYIGFYILWFVVMVLKLQFALTALSVRARLRAVNDALAVTARQVSVLLETPKNSPPINIYAIRVAPTVDLRRFATAAPLVDPLIHRKRDDVAIIKKTASSEPQLLVSPCEAIRRLATLRCLLCDVVEAINDSYGLPLLVMVICTLLQLIVTPYNLIMEIVVSTHRIHCLVLQFLWCTIHMCGLFVVVEPCHYTINEGKRTEGLVCRLMTSAPQAGVLPSRIESFSRQLMLQRISYSPMGMCTLDRPLVATIIGAVTTYLVILIQFQKNDT